MTELIVANDRSQATAGLIEELAPVGNSRVVFEVIGQDVPPQLTYKNSFEASSIWQRSVQIRSGASGWLE